MLGDKAVVLRALLGVCLVGLVGCGGGGGASPSTTVDPVFLEGREMVNIYEEAPPDGFVPREFVEHVAPLLGYPDGEWLVKDMRRLRPPDDRVIVTRRGVDSPRDKLIFAAATGQWRYSNGVYVKDSGPYCGGCGPVTISEAEALERAKALYVEIGVDVDAIEWSVETGPTPSSGEYVAVLVEGRWLVEGYALSTMGTQFEAEFADGDELVRLTGLAYPPRVVKQAGMLTPAEAYRQAGKNPAEAMALEGADLDDVELVWARRFDRSTQVSWAIPHYRVKWADMDPVFEDLAVSDVLAVRVQDVPSKAMFEREIEWPGEP